MRILHTVEFYEPSVGGAQEVVRRLSEHLVQRGHEVTVATSRMPDRSFSELNGVRIEEFGVTGNAVRGMTGEVERYREFLRSGQYDVMMNYAAQQWSTDAALELIGELPFATVLAPCGFSGLYQRPYREYFGALPDILRRYDGLVFHGSRYRDIEFAQRYFLARSTVIPHGVDVSEFGMPVTGFRTRFRIPEDEPLILTVGSHTGSKGHGQVIRAFRQARVGRATLAVLGNAVPGGCEGSCHRQAAWVRLRDRNKRVLIENVPRDVVREAFFEADLFVLASRIECAPTVLYESCAAGTPFLSADVGNASEIVEQTGSGMIVPTSHDRSGFAEVSVARLSHAISELLADSPRREEMGIRGREAWRKTFTWDHIAARYEAVYERAMSWRRSSM